MAMLADKDTGGVMHGNSFFGFIFPTIRSCADLFGPMGIWRLILLSSSYFEQSSIRDTCGMGATARRRSTGGGGGMSNQNVTISER